MYYFPFTNVKLCIMPKIKDYPPKLTLEVIYSDFTSEECTDRYDVIRSRYKTLVNYMIDHYDACLLRVVLKDNAMRTIYEFSNVLK